MLDVGSTVHISAAKFNDRKQKQNYHCTTSQLIFPHIFTQTSQYVYVGMLLHNLPCGKNARFTVPIMLGKQSTCTAHCEEPV
jgi:hypothetical protein